MPPNDLSHHDPHTTQSELESDEIAHKCCNVPVRLKIPDYMRSDGYLSYQCRWQTTSSGWPRRRRRRPTGRRRRWRIGSQRHLRLSKGSSFGLGSHLEEGETD